MQSNYLTLKIVFFLSVLSSGYLSQGACNEKLNEIKQYLGSSPDSVFDEVQIHIISKDNPSACKAAGYNVQVIASLYAGKYAQGDSIALIGEKYAKSVGEDSIYGRIKAMHGAVFDYWGDFDKAYKLYFEAGEVFLKLNDTLNYGDAFNNIGLLHFYINQFDSAEYYLTKATYIFETETQDLENRSYFLSSTYLNLGNISYRKGHYNVSNTRFFETLKHGEEMNDLVLQIAALSNIAAVFQELEDYGSALKYINKALLLSIDDPAYKKALVYYKKGVIHDNMGQQDSALVSFEMAKKLYTEAQFWNEVAMVKSSIGGVYIGQGKNQEGVDLCLTVLKEKLELEDTIGYYVTCNNVALGYYNLKNYSKSQEYCEIVDKGLKITDDYGLYLDNKKLYSKVAYNLGNSSKAFQLLNDYSTSKDSSFTADLFTHQTEMEAIYQLKDQEKKFAILKQEKITQEASLKAEKAEKEKQMAIVQNQNKQKWYLMIGLILVSVFGGFMYNRFKITKKQKHIIDQQKSEVEKQKEKIETQHLELEESHKEISDSIKYAERLQLAILPSLEDLKRNLNNGFVLFQPKDVVSGDFYWMHEVEQSILFAAADCTGHGVPGAMVSVVCSNALHRSVVEFGLSSPSEILNKTREIVIETFARSGKNVKDGMDIALCSISGDKLIYSGANNPLWILRRTSNLTDEQQEQRGTVIKGDQAVIEFKGNKQPVGLHEDMELFIQTEIRLFEGDIVYVFTDGFADQFGGEKNKKLMYKPFKNLLLDCCHLSMEEQKEELGRFFRKWRGENEQVDDVCVIGVRI